MKSTRLVIGTLLVLAAVSWANSWANAVEKSSDAVWLDRIEAGCKADAKKYYSVIHFKKRRAFVKRCVDRAYR